MVVRSLRKIQKTAKGNFRATLESPTKCSSRTNFQHITFDSEESLVALDSKGQSYLVQWISSAWWIKKIGQIDQAGFIKVNPVQRCEVIVGLTSGDIKLLDLNNLQQTRCCVLKGHREPLNQATFFENFCLTTSRRDAILWDLKTMKKVHQLRSNATSIRKGLISAKGTIAILYENDVIQSWPFDNLSSESRINLSKFGGNRAKDLAFIENDRELLVCARNKLLIFNTNTWELENQVDLNDRASMPRTILALSRDLDCGKVIAILFDDGGLKFLDLSTRSMSERAEGVRKVVASPNSQWLAAITFDGCLTLTSTSGVGEVKNQRQSEKKTNSPGKSMSHEAGGHLSCIRAEVREALRLERLQGILSEFGEYPERHRAVIWKTLLKIPENRAAYLDLSEKTFEAGAGLRIGLQDRCKEMLLEVTVGRLVQFCPMLGQCRFLAELIFPFIVVFRREPIVGLEVVLMTLRNICQRWFEYHPLPPINVLGIVENILGEVDSHLLNFYCKKDVTSTEYAWPLLRTLFSEVLEGREWMTLWDHLVTLGRPSRLIFCVVAYSICNREAIFEIMETKCDFEVFFRSQGQVSVKRIIKMAERIEGQVSERNHPRKYLRDYFKYLPTTGPYPPFLMKEYPKFFVGNLENAKELMAMKQEERLLKEEREKMTRNLEEKRLRDESQNFLKEIHHRRLHELHKCYSEELKLTKMNLMTERQKLGALTSGNWNDCQSLTKETTKTAKRKENRKKDRRKNISCDQLREQVDNLEEEVQTFLQSIRSTR